MYDVASVKLHAINFAHCSWRKAGCDGFLPGGTIITFTFIDSLCKVIRSNKYCVISPHWTDNDAL